MCCSYNNYVNASKVCSVKINILHVLYACDFVFCFLCRIQTIFVNGKRMGAPTLLFARPVQTVFSM